MYEKEDSNKFCQHDFSSDIPAFFFRTGLCRQTVGTSAAGFRLQAGRTCGNSPCEWL